LSPHLLLVSKEELSPAIVCQPCSIVDLIIFLYY